MEKNNGQPTGHVGPFYEKDYEYRKRCIARLAGAPDEWQGLFRLRAGGGFQPPSARQAVQVGHYDSGY